MHVFIIITIIRITHLGMLAIGGGGGEGLKVDRTYKLYYGGAQKRPDANYSRVIRWG